MMVKDHVINNYRVRNLDGKYFITTDHGSHAILSEDELKKLKSNNIEGKLYNLLEEREIILTKDNVLEAVRLTKNRRRFLSQGTSLHIMVLTRRCNMKCVYCHASAESEDKKDLDMAIETAKKTVDFIFQTPSQYITIEFQGGEPLLNFEVLKEIVLYAKEKNKEHSKNLRFSVVTNLSVMGEDKLRFLLDKEVDICTSLDGPKELHDKNRIYSKASNHELVVGWIKKINQEYEKRGKNQKVGALITLTRDSLKYPKEIVDQYIDLGLNQLHLRFMNNLGFAKKADKLGYSAEEFIDFWNNAIDYIHKKQKEGIDIHERMENIMFKKISTEFDPNYLELRSPCGAAIGQLTYDYNGDIYTCDEARMIEEDIFKLGNVFENDYREVVTGDKACAVVDASMNEQYICDTCAYKPYCGVCPVCNFSEQGSVIAKISETNRCKIYMAQFDKVVKERFIK